MTKNGIEGEIQSQQQKEKPGDQDFGIQSSLAYLRAWFPQLDLEVLPRPKNSWNEFIYKHMIAKIAEERLTKFKP